MNHAGFVFSAWGVSLAAVGGYGLRLIFRGRRASRAVPETRRRWMTTQDDS